MTELESLLVLNAVPGMTNRLILALYDFFPEVRKIFLSTREELAHVPILSAELIDRLLSFPKESFLNEDLRLAHKYGISILAVTDKDFPSLLRQIPDCPVVLYVKGQVRKLNDQGVAIVGSRKASVYGTTIAHQFALRLAENGINVISGLARGVDTAAHRGALQAKGSTISVLGHGLSYVYPPENEALFERITQEGAVVSEFPMRASPLPFHFPRRNRIISGLSKGVIVVEASEKSGALITADFALEQGRDVYAVPGKIDSATSRGVNNLIKQGAKLVMSIEDVLEDLNPQSNDAPATAQSQGKNVLAASEQGTSEIGAEFSLKEKSVLNFITETPVHIDELMSRVSCSSVELASLLFLLELKGSIKQLPGKHYKRQMVTTLT